MIIRRTKKKLKKEKREGHDGSVRERERERESWRERERERREKRREERREREKRVRAVLLKASDGRRLPVSWSWPASPRDEAGY